MKILGTRLQWLVGAPGSSVFLTWKIFIIFQVVVVGRFHSITSNQTFGTPEEGGGGGLPYEKAQNAHWKI